MTEGLRACIHRGAHEIGGTCVELECRDRRLLLDLGRALDGDGDVLPPIPGLAAADPSLLGIVVSHGHPDHYGLVELAHPDVPIFMGEAASRILAEASFFVPRMVAPTPTGYLHNGLSFDVCPFRITPHLIDHSAFDAYAIEVQADGRRLFYTGDLRAHGRKPGTFERLIRNPPRDVDVLLLEGTHVGRHTVPGTAVTSEDAVRDRALEVCRRSAGIVLAIYSPQNVDRLVSLYKAARLGRRQFVMDLYAASIAVATGRATIPRAGWEGVRVFVPHSQRARVIQAGAYHRITAIRRARIFPEGLAHSAGGLMMTFRHSMATDLERAGCLEGATALWCQWPGYLQEPSGRRLTDWLDRRGIPLEYAHASGHATVEDLQRLVGTMAPDRVVPIHTSAPELFPAFFPRVEAKADGEWWAV